MGFKKTKRSKIVSRAVARSASTSVIICGAQRFDACKKYHEHETVIVLNIYLCEGVSIQFFRGHTDTDTECFFPCPIAIKFSPVIGVGLKFVKMQF